MIFVIFYFYIFVLFRLSSSLRFKNKEHRLTILDVLFKWYRPPQQPCGCEDLKFLITKKLSIVWVLLILIQRFLLIQFLVSGTNAQSIGNTRDSLSFVVVNNAKIIQDSFTIIPQSVVITDKKGQKIDSSYYSVDNTTIFLDKGTYEKYQKDTLFYFYRKLRVNLGKLYFHLDSIALKKSENDVYIDYDMAKPKKSKNELLPSSLDYDGSFARGFSIGNRQNLSLNSSLNMQMAGEIGNGIRLKAAISDDNIPIQPEGTTQRLNEFDKVVVIFPSILKN